MNSYTKWLLKGTRNTKKKFWRKFLGGRSEIGPRPFWVVALFGISVSEISQLLKVVESPDFTQSVCLIKDYNFLLYDFVVR